MTNATLPKGTERFIQGEAGTIAVWEKHPAHPRSTALLCHGATLTGRSAFDFAHPGETSLMDWLVARGVGCVTFSIRGYGRSEGPENGYLVDTESAVTDFSAVADYIRDEHGVAAPLVVGWSWGGRITGLYTGRNPDRVDRLVLYAPAINSRGLVPVPPEPWHENTPESVLNRLEPDLTDPAIAQALAAHINQTEPRSPNGVYADLSRGAPVPVASAITRPTMMIYGAADRMYRPDIVAPFFASLATEDKVLALIPAAGHLAQFQHPRRRLFAMISAFLLPD